MAIVPGSTSGVWDFGLSNGQIIIEAFDRIGLRPPQLERHHFVSARNSINLELIWWSNQGVNLWQVSQGTVTLTAGVATYTLPANLVTLTDVWYTVVNGAGSGLDQDRTVVPMTRQEYAQMPNKMNPGQITRFWLEMLETPRITFWQPPLTGSPSVEVNYFGLVRSQTANLGTGERPDVLNRGLDALCARLSWRLAMKFAPTLEKQRKADGDEAWGNFAARDQEDGDISIHPDISTYARI